MSRSDNSSYRRERGEKDLRDSRDNRRNRGWGSGFRRNRGDMDREREKSRRSSSRQSQFQHSSRSSYIENMNAVKAFKANLPVCEICGNRIDEIENAIANKGSGNPVHFGCVLKILKDSEKVEANENITYIGQGRFAILHFDNPHDLRRFRIVKIIEWENREKRGEWRDTMASLYSQVK